MFYNQVFLLSSKLVIVSINIISRRLDKNVGDVLLCKNIERAANPEGWRRGVGS